jgi:hypothetical protein
MADSADRSTIVEGLERCRRDLAGLVESAEPRALRRRSRGTRWTNGQLLFHMVFGFMIVRTLLPLVRLLGRAPEPVSRRFAAALNASTGAFHVVNYLGPCGGALVFRGPRLEKQMSRTVDALCRRLDRESVESLQLAMHFPVGWDPYFSDTMSVRDLYAYGAKHFDHHRRQLTLDPVD